MAIPPWWSAQKLAEFLAAVSSSRTEATAALKAVERVAESLDAEVAAIVSRGEIVAAIGYPAGEAPLAELDSVARRASLELSVPGAGLCPATAVPLEHPPDASLVVARSGPDTLSPDEAGLLHGMARVTSMTLRMLRLLDDERASRAESQRQVDEIARLLAAVTRQQELLEQLADEQAALRRVATLVARQASAEQVLLTVAEEVGSLLRAGITHMLVNEGDGTATAVAGWIDPSVRGGQIPTGTRLKHEDDDLAGSVFRTRRSALLDHCSRAEGPIAEHVRRCGLRSAVASPIVVEGRLWGAMIAAFARPELPPGTGSRIEAFTQLLATALSNAEARAEVIRLAEEQAALHRVATLVAQGMAPSDIFSCVAEEIARISHVDTGFVIRFEPTDNTATVVAKSGTADIRMPVGSSWSLDGDSVTARVLRTGRSARMDDYGHASGPIAATLPGPRFSTAGAPIVIGDRLWGVAAATSPIRGSTLRADSAAQAMRRDGLPADAEERVANFADLIAIAISNAEARAQLTASRARVVAAADDARRRLERDLHDGIQQRLVSVALALRSAAATAPPGLPALQAQLSEVGEGLSRGLDELREISRGIHPVILSVGGLGPALKALARRSAVPVELDVHLDHVDRRLPERIEAAAYYVVSEALTNAAKHAQASVVYVDARAMSGVLRLSVRDDGVGGADPGQGSGLIGLEDRVEALGGTFKIDSTPGTGTLLLVGLPIEQR